MRKILFTLSMLVFGLGLFAAPVTMETAQQVAVNFYKHNAIKTSDYTISDEYANQYNGMTTYYVFIFKSGGFVMIAADDASIPILGYSTASPFDKNNIPPNAQWWFNEYSRKIKDIVDAKVSNVETVKAWKKIQDKQFPDTKNINAFPLLATTWNQDCYYNALCPAASGGPCSHVYTGCVATATAQVMKFWNYPTTGVGSHTYTDPTYGVQTVNFGTTTYDWGSMVNNVTSSNTAVATLMYDCGVSVDMTYGTSGSGAQETAIPNALISYFNYQPTAEVQFEASFVDSNWVKMLKTELDEGRPVLYAGYDGTEGHSFVFDGYNTSNQFDVNWGWSGYDDGYFAVGSLNPTGYAFNSNNEAVVRVRPKSSLMPIASFTSNTTTPLVGGTVTFTDMSTNSPTSWLWTFDGGSPSTYSGKTPPAITYAGPVGYYQVTLTVSNANGSDTKTSAQYINCGGTPSKWIEQNSAFATVTRGIDCISIVSPYTVWAGAFNGAFTSSADYFTQDFTRTTNGGITWTADTVIFTGYTAYGIANLAAINDTVCYAAMYPGTAATGGYVAETNDGGVTWSIANSPDYSASWLDFVYFFDANNGVSVGDPNSSHVFGIYTTSTAGASWTVVPSANIPTANTSETGVVNQFCAIGDTIWFGTQQGRLYKSVNKGLNWTVSTTGFGTSAQVTPVFRSGSVGIVTGSNYSTGAYLGMKITTDGGSTWNTVTPTGFYTKNPNISNIPGTESLWVDVSQGSGKGSSFSNNDCTYFYDIDTGAVQYTFVKFYDINTGWAGSYNYPSANVGGIYKWDPTVLSAGINPIKGNPLQINIYPNPTNNLVNIELSGITTQ
ncbi:MAG: C10 family peptidase [Bacteroidales bacterium]